jgi:hypothetical protein
MAGLGHATVVLRPSADLPVRKSPVELGLPLRLDVLADPREREALREEPLLQEAIKLGVVQVQDALDRLDGVSDAPEGALLQVGMGISPEEILWYLARRQRLPRLVILPRFFQGYWHSNLLAEAVLRAGCPAVALIEQWEDPRDVFLSALRSFHRGLLQDLPLDRALAQLEIPSEAQVNVALFAIEGAESTCLMSRALCEHREAGGMRFLDVVEEAKTAASLMPPQGELGQWVSERLRRSRGEVKDLASSVDGLTVEEPPSLEAVVRLRERVQEVTAHWQQLRNLTTRASRVGVLESMGPFQRFSTPAFPEDALASSQLPPRLTSVWVTDGDAQHTVPLARPLAPGTPYQLNVRVGFGREDSALQSPFPIGQLAEIFAREESVALDVLIFGRSGEFELHQTQAQLVLPRFGESTTVRIPFRLNATTKGKEKQTHRRLRVGIYHRNRLLQSLVVDLSVAEGHPTRQELDYAESRELLTVDELPPVTASLFINEAPDGTHWIGIAGLSSPAVLDLDPSSVKARVEELRQLYNLAQGKDDNRYGAPISSEAMNWEERAQELVRLAKAGRKAYYDLIVSHAALDPERKRELKKLLEGHDGLVQVARCRESAPGIPWNTLYDYKLTSDEEEEPSVCALFQAELRRNAETEGQRHDLLDDPARCAGRPECPLKQDEAEKVVCPFGFWGIRHRIEQPLHAIKPLASTAKGTEVGDTPRAAWSSPREIRADASLAVAYWDFANASGHLGELARLAQELRGGAASAKDRAQVRKLLATRKAGVIYFYCHGDEQSGYFALRMGDKQTPFKLNGDTLSQWELFWPQSPLVVLNGCETLAIRAELVHGFLTVLRDQGASGVVGPEVPIWTSIASRVGEALVGRFLAGEELGRALQGVQRALLRELNPVGLMYVAYARADLQLVAPSLPATPGGTGLIPPPTADTRDST